MHNNEMNGINAFIDFLVFYLSSTKACRGKKLMETQKLYCDRNFSQ
jgi:hypothetical protein